MTLDRDMYQEKKDYVEGLSAWLSAHPDFKDISYVHMHTLDEEFIRLDFITGPVVINITGNSLIAIGTEMARFMLGQKIDSIVTNIDKLRAVDKAFSMERRIA